MVGHLAILLLLAGVGLVAGCGDEAASTSSPLALRAVSFNTGTNPSLPHDSGPSDGYNSGLAAVTDIFYGNGLSWVTRVEEVRLFLADVDADVIAFQEIFHSADCLDIPRKFHLGWVCQDWVPGDRTVAQLVAGRGYQVACHLGKADKCIAVKRSFGTIRGCDDDLCLDALEGAPVSGCGGGSRIGRGVIDLARGGSLTVVSLHGTSGFSADDIDCRRRQFEQVFVDFDRGDGAPAANGAINLILGDLNTDPGRVQSADASARTFAVHVGAGRPFGFVSPVGREAIPTYAGLFNIDHVVSDRLGGSCWVPGIDAGYPPVTEAVYFDHRPLVCDLIEAR